MVKVCTKPHFDEKLISEAAALTDFEIINHTLKDISMVTLDSGVCSAKKLVIKYYVAAFLLA